MSSNQETNPWNTLLNCKHPLVTKPYLLLVKHPKLDLISKIKLYAMLTKSRSYYDFPNKLDFRKMQAEALWKMLFILNTIDEAFDES